MKKLEDEIQLSIRELGENESVATLVIRDQQKAMYKRGRNIYEIFYIKIQEYAERKIADRLIIYEHKELYPNSEAFGEYAWCFNNYDLALKAYRQL